MSASLTSVPFLRLFPRQHVLPERHGFMMNLAILHIRCDAVYHDLPFTLRQRQIRKRNRVGFPVDVQLRAFLCLRYRRQADPAGCREELDRRECQREEERDGDQGVGQIASSSLPVHPRLFKRRYGDRLPNRSCRHDRFKTV